MKALFPARKCQPELERDNISNPLGCLHKNRALEKRKVGEGSADFKALIVFIWDGRPSAEVA